jgi:hypothetical protein
MPNLNGIVLKFHNDEHRKAKARFFVDGREIEAFTYTDKSGATSHLSVELTLTNPRWLTLVRKIRSEPQGVAVGYICENGKVSFKLAPKYPGKFGYKLKKRK